MHQTQHNKLKKGEPQQTTAYREIFALQFAANERVIQKKLMKVIYTNKNMMIREFQLDMVSALIQVLNLQMHKSQFVSMMMVTQMKLTKVIRNLKNMPVQEFQLKMESKLI
jgi:hypothetical protein